MKTWISLAVLSTSLVITLSLPSPDNYQIPEVGNGQRSQYYVLHNDGTYKFGYDTGEGAFESTKLHAGGNLEGKFGYTDLDGNQINLEYESGTGGFVARGAHLPQPPPELLQAASLRSAEPFVDPLASDDLDPSYNFGFNSENYTRSESTDDDGTVTGSYSYIDEFGRTRSYTYRAGKGIGFVIEGDDIPPDTNTAPVAANNANTQFRSSTQYTSASQNNQRQRRPVSNVSNRFSGATTAQQTINSLNNRNTINNFGSNSVISSQNSQRTGDASYSFSYDADDHSRTETSDSDLNVAGSFSFVSDDGQERTLNYVAGTGTGFQASGDHLPVAPVEDFGARITGNQHQTSRRQQTSGTTRNQQITNRRQQTSRVSGDHHIANRRQEVPIRPTLKTNYQQDQFKSSNTINSVSNQRLSTSLHSTSNQNFQTGNSDYTPANIRSSTSPDGSYTFSYNNPDHSRSESGDSDNSVFGNFDFTSDDDGEQRQIQYQASAGTGFIAEGDHIPIGPIVPGAPSGQPTGRIVPVQEEEFIDPLANSDSDASYAFNFDSDSYSRTETADEDGNVSGTYTVVDEDGVKRTYSFRAGRGIGYETKLVSETPSSSNTFSGQRQTSSSITSSSQNNQRTGSSLRNTQFTSSTANNRAHSVPAPVQQYSASNSQFSSSSSGNRQNPGHSNNFQSSSRVSASPNSLSTNSGHAKFQLHQYDASGNSGKYGYAIQYE